jgi:hypothetical protein
MSKAVMRQALDALEWADRVLVDSLRIQQAIESLTAALAEPEPIPYGWMIEGVSQAFFGKWAESDAKAEAGCIGGTCKAFPIYATPVSYVQLSDDQITDVWREVKARGAWSDLDFARAVEQAVRGEP